jgi:hypothetical protein
VIELTEDLALKSEYCECYKKENIRGPDYGIKDLSKGTHTIMATIKL